MKVSVSAGFPDGSGRKLAKPRARVRGVPSRGEVGFTGPELDGDPSMRPTKPDVTEQPDMFRETLEAIVEVVSRRW